MYVPEVTNPVLARCRPRVHGRVRAVPVAQQHAPPVAALGLEGERLAVGPQHELVIMPPLSITLDEIDLLVESIAYGINQTLGPSP